MIWWLLRCLSTCSENSGAGFLQGLCICLPLPLNPGLTHAILISLVRDNHDPGGREGRAPTHPRHGSFAFYFRHWRWDFPLKMLFVACRLLQQQQEKHLWGRLMPIACFQIFQHINLKSLMSTLTMSTYKKSKCWKITFWCKCTGCLWKLYWKRTS